MRKKNQESRVHPLPHFLTFCAAEPRAIVRGPVWINRKLALSCRSCLLPVPSFWIALFEYPIFHRATVGTRVYLLWVARIQVRISLRDWIQPVTLHSTARWINDESSISERRLDRDQKCGLPLKTGYPNIFLNLTKRKNIQNKLRTSKNRGLWNNFHHKHFYSYYLCIYLLQFYYTIL